MKIILNMISTNLVTNSLLSLFCDVIKPKNKNQIFEQFGGLVTRNTFAFCLQPVGLYFKGMPNSIDFYKKIFLHVIPARIIVP